VSIVDRLALPEAAPALLLVPAAALALWALDRARAKRLADAAGRRSAALSAELGRGRRRLRRGLFAGAVLLGVLAAMQPVWGESVRGAERQGVDLVVCLDVSRSMLARDVEPSRLERARREIRALAERAEGDRLGLVVFAGEARLLVPLTRDGRSFAELATGADPLSVARGGTDLGAGLSAALAALEGRTGRHEAVLLLTDGDDLEERGLAVARTCRARKITVHCVGFGSALGAKIPVETGSGEAFLRDASGREVVSALDPAGLRAIAETTGGEYVDAGAGDRPLADLHEDRILSMARRAFEGKEREERENRFQWPLLAAFILWILEFGLSDRRR
jgi:Ca-activated chloride channel family protein